MYDDDSAQTQTADTQSSFPAPAEYADQAWTSKINSVEDLWKNAANANSLIGKRGEYEPPAQDADAESWESYYDKLRPTDDYKFDDVEGIPDGVDISSHQKDAKQIMREVGLTQKQANDLWQKYMGLEISAFEKNGQALKDHQEALDNEFDELSGKMFGDQYDAKAESAKALFNKFAPDELKPTLAELGEHPKLMAAMIHVLSSASAEIGAVKKEYGAEDKLPADGGGGVSSNIDDIRKELAQLRTGESAKNFTHPEHKQTIERIKTLQDGLRRHYNS
jgi:hypothetical protein